MNSLTRSSATAIPRLFAAIAALGLAVGAAVAAQSRVVSAGGQKMTVDTANREVRIVAEVTKDPAKPGVTEWGKRGAAWFGCEGGKAQAFFVFTTKVERAAIDDALREIGLKSRRQIGDKDYKQHSGLKPETKPEDYLDGDPVLVSVRFQKDGKVVERALEDFISEKILVQGKEVVKPYTPHWVYHGTAEAIRYASGCVTCPEGCWGGLIADNSVPVLTLDRWYRVDWEKMPPVGSRVEVVVRSMYSAAPASALQ
jgi:hypothetical protein